MKQRFGTIYVTDDYVEVEVLDSKGLATYAIIDENNGLKLGFDINKALNEPYYISDWLDNNEEVFREEWDFQQHDGMYVW